MRHYSRLLCGAAAIAILTSAGAAHAETKAQVQFDIPAQPLTAALNQFGIQSGSAILFKADVTGEKVSRPLNAAAAPETALAMMLDGTGLSYRREGQAFVIVSASDPQSGSAAGDGADGTVQALVVTAQKREENIQDVPIAMSAFTQEDLTRSQVAGGPDLITQIPNFSFTKTNFSGYSIQIRGIGTQAVSATTDPAVAVAFNNTPFIRNRFFEQEFYDLERIEVLRGPQGTLYGRNATAGVVNIISAKPKFTYASKLSADVGNYNSTRLEGMINLPLVEDKVALRIAGAWTKRDGYAFNQMTNSPIDGRDLWSTRVSLRFTPTDRIDANLIWDHFEENDDRLRSGKQLCKKDIVTEVGGLPVAYKGGVSGNETFLSQGCEAVSLYSPEAFQTPNGYSLPYFAPLSAIGLPVHDEIDPYLNASQSQDLRVIESSIEPEYRAKTDIAELQLSFDISENLTLNSETAYDADSLFSMQDFNRFTTTPGVFLSGPSANGSIERVTPGGVFCDPQLGCSDRLLLADLSTSNSTQFSQEFRLSSEFSGPFNFSLGANYLRHDAEDKYYVFINTVSLWTAFAAGDVAFSTDPSIRQPYVPGVTDNNGCMPFKRGRGPGSVGDTSPIADPNLIYGIYFPMSACTYMDPNPIGALNDQGRNYFLSKNPYKLVSYALFGETYYNITDDLKLTAGLRFTVDRKTAPQIPSWLLAQFAAGPYPVAQTVFQEWREPTGRLALDWKPDLSFTDETLIYGSYAHGYKAGGANPPPPVLVTYLLKATDVLPNEILPDTFGPEFVDAFELGTKNTLLDGSLTLNLAAFYYDYKGYQVSEIRNRSAVNSNYDADVWGLEFEGEWRPTEALRLGLKGGYNMTRIADGESAIDLMDRTAGHTDWVVMRPFPTVPSNCILPVYVVTAGNQIHAAVGTGNTNVALQGACVDAWYFNNDPVTSLPYVANPTVRAPVIPGGTLRQLGPSYASYPGFNPQDYPEANGGRGFAKPLGGNELPNAPNWTATVTADYTLPLKDNWLLTLHGDYHYQGPSWARVFNSDPYDRIHAFTKVNLAAIATNEDAGWTIMAYVKNVLDETAITGAFLNSDDTGLTTNVFLTEPRLYGLRVTKEFTGSGGWLESLGQTHTGPYPFAVELGGGVSRFDGSAETYRPAWMDKYSAAFPMAAALSAQDDDLDWGDVRDVKLTYKPSGSVWRLSAGARFGKTNGQGRSAGYEHVPGNTYQRFNNHFQKYYAYYTHPDNRLIVAAHDTEEHLFAEFAVGRDIGMGEWVEDSTVVAGIRYGELKSISRVAADGVPDGYISPKSNLSTLHRIMHRSHYTTTLDSQREFRGAGPTLSWDASRRLFGNEDVGHADLTWAVTGGALFGRQSVDSSEARDGRYYFSSNFTTPTAFTTTHLFKDVVARSRSKSVTVPLVDLSLGLAYTAGRVKVSSGYRWERYFNAIDGGYEEHKSYDRTIDGPYFKIAVGFGG